MTIQEFKKSKEDKAKSVLSGEKNINGLRVRFTNIDFYKDGGDFRNGKQSSNNVVHASDRVFVLAEFNGIRIPFYISTGDGGKEKVPVGKWYPIFGHLGWINKGSQEEINDAYGSKALKDIKNWLDQNVGFLGEADDKGYFGLTSETKVNEGTGAKLFYDSLNRDLKPTRQRNQFDKPEEYQNKLKNIQLGKQHMIDLVARATGENKVENTTDTPSSAVGELKRYIVSQCKGDAYEIFLWSQGKSIVNNPPVEIRNIIMGMNPKITGSNFLIDNIDAVNYFKSWVPMKTLDDEAFEYILDNNEKYLKLYRAFGRPTQKQNFHIIKKMEYGTEEEGFLSYDNIEALDKGGEKLLGQNSVKKDYPEMPPLLKSSSAIRKIRF